VISAVKTGPLQRNAAAVQEMILDSERTLLLPVALAEELPVRETEELVARVRAEIGIAVDRVVINAMMPEPFPAGCEDLLERLGALSDDVALHPLPSASVMQRCAEYWRSRRELHLGYAAEIAEKTALPVVSLPYLPEGIRSIEDLNRLGSALLETPA
jgi:anion-transporting  ArsA/GET3 family ATPase